MKAAILCFVFLLISNVAFVSSAVWTEVTRFSGSGDYTTDYFTCNHVEWRINWNYTPSPNFPEYAGFAVHVYQKGEDVLYIESIIEMGNTTTNGTTYIHNKQGEFYLKIGVTSVENYLIVVEQDLQSIPEFSVMILLPLLTAGTLAGVILARRQKPSIR